jgi:hypothetical protein
MTNFTIKKKKKKNQSKTMREKKAFNVETVRYKECIIDGGGGVFEKKGKTWRKRRCRGC